MYYDLLIQSLDRYDETKDRYIAITKIDTYARVKSFCGNRINSRFYCCYVRKVFPEYTTSWRQICRLSDYYSNLSKQSDYACMYITDKFNKNLKNGK